MALGCIQHTASFFLMLTFGSDIMLLLRSCSFVEQLSSDIQETKTESLRNFKLTGEISTMKS